MSKLWIPPKVYIIIDQTHNEVLDEVWVKKSYAVERAKTLSGYKPEITYTVHAYKSASL